MAMSDVYRLGASMYVPSDSPNLQATFSGNKFPSVRSLIACTEDAVLPSRIDQALAGLSAALRLLPGRGVGPLRFVRCRNPHMLEQILALKGIGNIDGFVLPKADEHNLPVYESLLGAQDYYVMPTLETIGVFDAQWQADMCSYLRTSKLKDRVLALRIGGNDLLKHLGLRRLRGVTSYETPLGVLISQLVLTFRPHGFHLSAPVYDYFDDPATLYREVAQDVRMGLIGKTAIHPSQAAIIEQGLRVSREDMRAAQLILGSRGQEEAVFKHGGGMHETIVHQSWAQQTLDRASAGGRN
jgi:citrate lyase beta subunit